MLKNLAYMTLLALGLTSCHTLKPLSSAPTAATHSPAFIQHITIAPGTVKSGGGTIAQPKTYTIATPSGSFTGSVIESLHLLQFKYGILLDVPVEQLTNLKLLETIDEWYGTRYRHGGNTKDGIDCSGFACMVMTTVFGHTLPRTSREQYAASERVSKEDLQEGDLVFFSISGGISHVGVYLGNNKFVHASTSSGVMISDLNEEYYARKYAGGGRVSGGL